MQHDPTARDEARSELPEAHRPPERGAAPAIVDGARSRRRLLNQTLRGLLALPVAAGVARAQGPPAVGAGRASAAPTLVPPPAPDDPLVLRALVERLGYGFDLELYQRGQAIGYDALLEEQLHPEGLADPAGDAVVSGLPSLSMTSKELLDAFGPVSPVPVLQLQAATALRAMASSRRLFERVVGVWSDHFNVYVGNLEIGRFKVTDDRDVIRAHAFGHFPALLRASADSAAMLSYLDNVANTVAGAQENYARELMELHTLGVEGGYTEQDVKEVARCFTGWRGQPQFSPTYGEFQFVGLFPDQGAKTVLGVDLPPFGGKTDGDTVLTLLTEHPSTSRFVAEKLVTRLLTYAPPATVRASRRAAVRPSWKAASVADGGKTEAEAEDGDA